VIPYVTVIAHPDKAQPKTPSDHV